MKRIVQNPLKANTIFHFDNLIINKGEKNPWKMILMRHAQSHFNNEIMKIENSKDSMVESEFKKRMADIRFSSQFIDSELTEKGKSQCHAAGKQLNQVELEYVIVSPMRRALMTCEEALSVNNTSKPKVIVYPYLFEKIEDSCDLMKDVKKNMKDYSHYNWNYFQTANFNFNYQLGHCDAWPPNFEDKRHVNNQNGAVVNHENGIDIEKQLDIVLKAMRILGEENKYIESSYNTIQRLGVFKNYINSFISEKKNELQDNKRVLVIGHSILFKHLTANLIEEETHEPVEKNVLKNCELAELSFL